jgi:hypothetical protein
METINLQPIKAKLSAEEKVNWEKTLAAGVLAQNLIGNSIAVGGTAATIYAGHRLSSDTDHLLVDLKDDFDAVLNKLSSAAEWKTARLNRPVLILGSINDCEVGFRQSRRVSPPIETVKVATKFGDLVIPTLDEMIGMKAFLAYQRKTVRDFLDFAALTTCTNDEEVIASLLKLDERYGESQTNSICLEVARNFANPNPIDLEKVDLSHYKALATEWHDWTRTTDICRKFGILLGEKILEI